MSMDSFELGLFCKSFADDLDRFKDLIDSIDRSTPKSSLFRIEAESDLELFKPLLSQSSYAKLLTDEDLLTQSNALGESRAKSYSGSLLQQIIKVAFGMIEAMIAVCRYRFGFFFHSTFWEK